MNFNFELIRRKAKNYFKRLISHPFRLMRKIICRIRSKYFSFYIDEGSGKISVKDPWLKIKIQKSSGAKLIINGNLRIKPHIGGNEPVRIYLGNDAKLQINGDFTIGHGVRISVSKGGELSFGGKKEETDSGITSDTLIMVFNKVKIGYDFICAWNVFISDSDWHQIKGQITTSDIEIGNHVWIANSCSILKGSKIGDGSIVASHSKLGNKEYPSRSIIAGIPGDVVRSSVEWSRDIKGNL